MEQALKILSLNTKQPDAGVIQQAEQSLRNGNLVIIPTETVYGLAADARNPKAMQRIYTAKGRHSSKPIALFAPGVDAIETEGMATFNETAKRLAAAFWPGPLTLVLPTPNGNTGFRIPNHPVPLKLLEAFGGFLAVTSANRSDEPETNSGQEAANALGNWVDLVLDAGILTGDIPSTVVKITSTGFLILRHGAISEEKIHTLLET